MKYIILSDTNKINKYTIPRQLTIINNETLIGRTIRLLKENGVKDIIITSHDKRFNNLGAERYEPLYNDFNPEENKGYWVSAFPIELLDEPTVYLFGDVYYSEKAIKTIVNTDTKDILFFCSYLNKDKRYIKHHDEPLAFKVIDYIIFKEHIERMKAYKDSGEAVREPITWELYRSINNQNLKEHRMTDNYVVINDESCDIDTLNDIIKLENILGGNSMIKAKVIEEFTLNDFDKIKKTLVRADEDKKEDGRLYKGDIFECDTKMAQYLTGENKLNISVIEVIEIKPKEDKIVGNITYNNDNKELKTTFKKTSKKKTTKSKK